MNKEFPFSRLSRSFLKNKNMRIFLYLSVSFSVTLKNVKMCLYFLYKLKQWNVFILAQIIYICSDWTLIWFVSWLSFYYSLYLIFFVLTDYSPFILYLPLNFVIFKILTNYYFLCKNYYSCLCLKIYLFVCQFLSLYLCSFSSSVRVCASSYTGILQYSIQGTDS